VRTAQMGIVVLSLLALACGKTARHGSPTDSPGEGGLGARAGEGGTKAVGGGPGVSSKGGSPTGAGAGKAGSGAGLELSHVELAGAPIYTRVQRLSNRQWEHAVTDILRLAGSPNLSASFTAPVLGTTDFDNNEAVLYVNGLNFRDFESGAEAAAALATGSTAALAALYGSDDAQGFVRAFGRRAFRRPLTSEEELKYQEVFALGESLFGPGFANGAALVIRGMLQSPHFLYRTELGPGGEPLSSYEIASKLSFWLLGTTPSDALLDSASARELDTVEGIEAAARRMLEDPRAVEVMRDFHAQLLGFRRYAQIDKERVPEYDPAILSELLLASHAFFDRVFQEDLGLVEILTSNRAYVGARLAPLYGLAPPSAGLELRELGPSRSGYFMQVPFLMLWGNNDQSDPIHRGFNLQQMTCGALPPPDADVPPPPPAQPGQTTREHISELTSCGASCHAYFDPLGFALENFDGLGRERSTDNGKPIDTSGSYPFAEGVAEFSDGTELMNIMAASAQVHTCYSKKLTSYALGRDIVERDRPLLESLARVSLGNSLQEMVMALVRDPAFRTRQEEAP
jgi:hypothetical protein